MHPASEGISTLPGHTDILLMSCRCLSPFQHLRLFADGDGPVGREILVPAKMRTMRTEMRAER